MVHLGPDERLHVDGTRDNVVCVADGLLYVRVDDDDDDVLLMGGDRIVLHAGTAVHAWNAGDEPAQVIVGA